MSNFLELGMLKISLDAQVRLEWKGGMQEYIVSPEYYDEMQQNYINDYVGDEIRDIGTLWSEAGGMDFNEENLNAYVYWNNQPVPNLNSYLSANWSRLGDLLDRSDGLKCIEYASMVYLTHNDEELELRGYELVRKIKEAQK